MDGEEVGEGVGAMVGSMASLEDGGSLRWVEGTVGSLGGTGCDKKGISSFW